MTSISGDSKVVSWRCETEKIDDCERPSASVNSEDTPINIESSKRVLPASVLTDDHSFQAESSSACDVTFDDNAANLQTTSIALCLIDSKSNACELDVPKRTEDEEITKSSMVQTDSLCSASFEDDLVKNVGTDCFNREEIHSVFPENTDSVPTVPKAERQSAEIAACLSESFARSNPQKFEDFLQINNSTPIKSELQIRMLEVNVSNSIGNIDECQSDTYAEHCVSMPPQDENNAVSAALFDTALQVSMNKVQMSKSGVCTSTTPSFLNCTEDVTKVSDSISDFREDIKTDGKEKVALLQDSKVRICTDISDTFSADSVLQGSSQGKTEDIKACVPREDVEFLKTSRVHNAGLAGFDVDASEHCGIDSISMHRLATESTSISVGDFDSRTEISQPSPFAFGPPVKHKTFLYDSLSDSSSSSYVETSSAAAEKLNKLLEIGSSEIANFINPGIVLSCQKIVCNNSSERKPESVEDLCIESTEETSKTSVLEQRFGGKDSSVLMADSSRVASSVSVSDIDSSMEACSVLEADSNWDGNCPVKVVLQEESCPVSCEIVNSSLSDLEVSSTSDGPLSCSHRKLFSTYRYDGNLPFFETSCSVEGNFSCGDLSRLEDLSVIEPENCFADAKLSSNGSSSPRTASILNDTTQVGYQCVSNSNLNLGMKSHSREILLQNVSSSSKTGVQFEDRSPSDISEDQSVQTTNCSIKDHFGTCISRPNSASRELMCSNSDAVEISDRPNIGDILDTKSSYDLEIESFSLEDHSELQGQSPKTSKSSGFCVDSILNQDQTFLACSSNDDAFSSENLLAAMEPVVKISASDELSLLKVSEGGYCITKRLCVRDIRDEDDAIHSTGTLADFAKNMSDVQDEENNAISSSETAATYASEVAHSNKDMCMELSNVCDDNSGIEKCASELLSHNEVSSGILMQKGSCDSTEITNCSTLDVPVKPTDYSEEVSGMDTTKSSYKHDDSIFESPDQIGKSEISNNSSDDLIKAGDICKDCVSTKTSDEDTDQSTAFVRNAGEVCKTVETTLDTNIRTAMLEVNPNEEEIRKVSLVESNQNMERFSEKCTDPVKLELSLNEFACKDDDSYAKLLDSIDEGMTQVHDNTLSDTEEVNCWKEQHVEDPLEQKFQPREDLVLRCDQKDGTENEQTATSEQHREWQNEFCLVIDCEQQQNFITEKKCSLESSGICEVSPKRRVECEKEIRNSEIHEQHCEKDIECSTAGLGVECLELEPGYNGKFEHNQNLIVSEGYKAINLNEENIESTVIKDRKSKFEIRQQYRLNKFQQQQQEQQQTPRQQQEQQLHCVETKQGAIDFLKAQEYQEENREFEDENVEENGLKAITQSSIGKLVSETKTDQEFSKDDVDHADKSLNQEHKSYVESDTGLIVQNADNCQNRGEKQESSDNPDNEQIVESEDIKDVEQEDNEHFETEIFSKNHLECYHGAELVMEEQDKAHLNEHEHGNSEPVQTELCDISEQQPCNRKAQEKLECQQEQREVVDHHSKELLGEVESRMDHEVGHDKDCNEIVNLEQNLAREAEHKDEHIYNVEQELKEECSVEVKDGTKSIIELSEKSETNVIVQLSLTQHSIVELECVKHFDGKMEESAEVRQGTKNEDIEQGCELIVHECQTDQVVGNKEQKQNPGKPEHELNLAVGKEQDGGDQQNQNKEEELTDNHFQMVGDLEESCQNTGDELYKGNPDVRDQNQKFVVELERDLGEIKRCDEIIKNEDGTDRKDVGQDHRESKKIGRKQKQTRKTCVREENINKTEQEKKNTLMVKEDKRGNTELVHEQELIEKTAVSAMLDPEMVFWNKRSEEKHDCCRNELWINSENVAKQEISKIEEVLIPDESSRLRYLPEQNVVANIKKENSLEVSVSMTYSGNLNELISKVREPESSVFRANCQAEIINDKHNLLTAVDMRCATEVRENFETDLKTGTFTDHQLSYLKDVVATGGKLRGSGWKGISEDTESKAARESSVDESASCDFSMNLCIDFPQNSASDVPVLAENLSFKKPDCGADIRNEKTSDSISKSTEHFGKKKPKGGKGRRKTIADKNNFNIFQKNQSEMIDDMEVGNSDPASELSSVENQLRDVDALEDTVKDLSLSKEERLSGECTTAFKKSRKKKKVNKMAEDVPSSKEGLSENSVPLDYHRPLEPTALLQSVYLAKDATEKTINQAGNSDSFNNDVSSETASKRSYWEMICYENSTVSDPSLSSIRQLEECVKAISISLQNCISNNTTTCGIDSLSNCFQDSNLGLDFKLHNGDQFSRSFPQQLESLPGLKSKSKSFKNHRITKCLSQEQGCDDLNKLPWIGSRKGGRKKMAAQNDQADPVVQSDLEIVRGEVESAKDFGCKRRRSKKNGVSFNSPCVSTNVCSVLLEQDRDQSIDFATDLSKKTCKASLEGCSPILQVATDETPADRMSNTLSVSADVQSNQKKSRNRSNRATKMKKTASGCDAVSEVQDLSANKAGSVSSEFNDMRLGVHTVTNNEIEFDLGKQVIKEVLPQKLSKKTKLYKVAKFSPGLSDEADDVLLVDLRENNVPKKKMRRNSKKEESSEIMCPLSDVRSHLEPHFEVNFPLDKPKRKRRTLKKGKHNLETVSQEVKCSLSGFLHGVELPVDRSLAGGESAATLGSQDIPPSFNKFQQEKAESLITANSQPAFAEMTDVAKSSANNAGKEDYEEGSKSECAIFERVTVACLQPLKVSNGVQPDEISCSKDAVVQDLHGGNPITSMNVKPFACSQCGYRAKKKGQLRKHLGVHRIYGCAHCDFACGTQEELDGHMLTLHPSRCGRKLCRKCHVLFQMDVLDFHERSCTGEKCGWECRECGRKFKFVSAMRTHLKRWHSDRCVSKNENEDEEEKEAADSLAFNSSSCDKFQGDDRKPDDTECYRPLTTTSDSERPLSLRVVSSPIFSPEKLLDPPAENFSVPNSMRSLEQLSNLSHSSEDVTPTFSGGGDSSRLAEVIKIQPGSEMSENSSGILERAFSKSSSPIATKAEVVTLPDDPALQIALKEGKPLLCISCNKYFKNKKTLTSHSLTKHGFRPDLPRRRSSKVSSSIGLHAGDSEPLNQADSGLEMSSKMSVDAQNVVFTCFFQGCGRQFKKLERLHKHEEKHAVEKQYRCDWIGCRKAFLHLDNLQLHRQQHTAAKPFPCDQCSLGYWQKCSLKSHQLKAHGKTCDGTAEGDSVRCTDATENLEAKCRQEVDKNDDKNGEKTAVNSKELNIYEFCESEDDDELVKLISRPSSMGRCKASVFPKGNVSGSSPLDVTDDELSISAKTGLKKPLKTYLKVKKPKSEGPSGGVELDGASCQESDHLESVPGGLYEGNSKCVAEVEEESNIRAGHNQRRTGKSVKERKNVKDAADAAERQTGLCGSQNVDKKETKSFSKKRKHVATLAEERIVIKAVLPRVRKLGKKKSKKSEPEPFVGKSLDVPEELNSVVKKAKSRVLKTKSKKTRSTKTYLPLQDAAMSEFSCEQKKMAIKGPRHNRSRSRSETKKAETEVDVQLPRRGKKRKAEAIDNEISKPKKKRAYNRSKPPEVRGKKTRNKRRRKEKKKKTVAKREATGKLNNNDKKKTMNCVDFEPSSTEILVSNLAHGLTDDPNEDVRDLREFEHQTKMKKEKLSIEEEEEEESEQLDRENSVERNNESVAADGQSDDDTEDEIIDSYYTGNKYLSCYKGATQAAGAMSSEEDDASVEASERENVEDPISRRAEENQRCEDESREKEFGEIDSRTEEEYKDKEIEVDNEREFREYNEMDKSENEGSVEEEEEEEEEEENKKRPDKALLESASDDGMENVPRLSAPFAQCTDVEYSCMRFGGGEDSRYQMNEQGTRHEMDEDYCSFDRLMPNDYHLHRLPAKSLVDESEMQPSLAVPVIVSQAQSCHEPYTTTTTTSAAIVTKQPGVVDRDYSSVYSDSYDVTCHRYSSAEAMYRRQTTSPDENHSSDENPGENRSLLTNSYSDHYPLLSDRTTGHNSLQSLESLASGDHHRSLSGTSFFDVNSKTLAEQVGKSLTVGFGGSQPSSTPTFEVPPVSFSVEQTSAERPQDFSYAAGGRSNSKFAHSQHGQDGLSAVPRSNLLASELASPGTAISRDFFGQYFQEPGHLPVGQDQRSQGFSSQQQKQQQQSGLSSLQRGNSEFFRCNTPALLPPSTPCSTVPESVLGMKHAQLTQPSPTAQVQHWSRSHDERNRPWDPVAPTIVQSDTNSQRNSYSSAVRPEYSLEAGGSLIQSARRMESSSFRGVSPSVLGQPDLYGVPGAYSIAYSPSTASVGYSRTLPASQKHLEEAYRHAAASHISDYRTFSAQAHPAPLSDVYGTMGINSTLTEFDRYYYSARDVMYRSQQLASAVPHPFMQQGTATPQMAMSYADRTTYGRESAYGQPSPYGFMCDKQYLSPANSGGGKVVQGSSMTSDYLHVPVDQQDPYRRSVIYNMMPRYF